LGVPMSSQSKFAKKSWRFNPETHQRLITFLRADSYLVKSKGRFNITAVADRLDVSSDTVRRLISQKEGSNLSSLRKIFDSQFPGETDDLDDDTFGESYCEVCLRTSESEQCELPQITADGDLGILEYLLMFKVERHGSDAYRVKAKLVSDRNPSSQERPHENDVYDIKGLTLDGIAIEEFEVMLDQAIEECSETYGIDRGDLIVQWFLPMELFHLQVEQIQLRMGRRSCVNSGKTCNQVIIRSYDLHFDRCYRKSLAAWKSRWQQFLEKPQQKVSQTLPEISPEQNLPEGWRNNCQIWGSRFTIPIDPKMREDFWDRKFMEGFPFALWRRDGNNSIGKTEFEQLAEQAVRDLPTAVTQIYRNTLPGAAPSQSATTMMGRPDLTNLALLWDNPFRPFPDSIDYQSA
jgi:hypothetical protein